MKPPKTLNRFVALFLVSVCATSLFVGNVRVQADGGSNSGSNSGPGSGYSGSAIDKCSPDLLKIADTAGATKVRVIVQSSTTSAGLLDSLLRDVNAVVLGTLGQLNIRLAEMSAGSAKALAYREEISFMSLDTEVRSFGHVTNTAGAQQSRSQTNAAGGSYTLDGSGVRIAILDSGIDVNHKSFTSQAGKVVLSKDFTGENRTDDPYGHGTHVAAVAAGSGAATGGKYEGVASAANLLNLRVMNAQGIGSVSSVLKALDWVYANRNTYNIRVVNMSLGAPALSSYKDDPLCNAVRKLSNAGIVVVAAAGNNGKSPDGQKVYGGIHTPGNEPSAITVGASNSYGSDPRNEDSITTYSSRGPTRSFATDNSGVKHYDNLIKPDLVAPGNKIISAQAPNNLLVTTHPELQSNIYSTSNMKMMYMSGTSVSAPMVAGAAAMLLEANPNLTPNMVKMILMYTAQPLAGANTFEQARAN